MDRPLPRPLFWLALAALTGYAALFGFIAWEHVRYPGFTEAMEGDVLQHIERFTDGLPLYPEPGEEYIALAYMPLYYVLAAPFYLTFGDSFIGPRLLSCLCAALSCVLIGWIGWRESRDRTIALLAAAIFLAGYRVMDAYLTCAMPDALLLLWLLLGYCFLAYGTTCWHDVVWLACFTLAFWTKQHGAFFFGFAVLYALLFRNNALPRWSLVPGLLIGGPLAYLLLGSQLGERFFYHTFLVPRRWEHNVWFALRRSLFLLACFAPVATVLTGCYLACLVRPKSRQVSPLAWFVLTTLLSTMITMSAAGSSNNHYIPLLAIMAVSSALGVQWLCGQGATGRVVLAVAGITVLSASATLVARQHFPNHVTPLYVPICMAIILIGLWAVFYVRLTATWLAGLWLLLGQFAVTAYYPPDYLPAPGYTVGLAYLQAELGHLDGPTIWVPYGNVPAALTGAKLARAPSWVALEDILRQRGADDAANADLQPFRLRILAANKLYVLSHEPIRHVPVWNTLADKFVLVRDYEQEFICLSEVTRHWYGGGSYPRFLYRVSGSALDLGITRGGTRPQVLAAPQAAGPEKPMHRFPHETVYE